jgi:hypothetical protein
MRCQVSRLLAYHERASFQFAIRRASVILVDDYDASGGQSITLYSANSLINAVWPNCREIR